MTRSVETSHHDPPLPQDPALTLREWQAGILVRPESQPTFEAFVGGAVLMAGDRITVFADVDEALTARPDPETGRHNTSWAAATSCMTPAGRRRHRQLYQQFSPLEKVGRLSPDAAAYWQVEALASLEDVPVRKLEAASQEAELDPHAVSFMQTCELLGIPVHLVSAGNEIFIETVFGKYGLHPASVITNRFVIREGKIAGVAGEPVHSQNKAELVEKIWGKEAADGRTTGVAVGDGLDDARMVSRTGDLAVGRVAVSARIGRDPEDYAGPDGPVLWEKYVEESHTSFDAVATRTGLADLFAAIAVANRSLRLSQRTS